MKQKSFLSFITAGLLITVSCGHIVEEEIPQQVGQRIITATLEREEPTKTQLSAPDAQGIYYPYWSKGDALAVYADGLDIPDTYALVEGEGTDKASFAGSLYGSKMVALYPACFKSEEGLQGEVLTLALPAVQQYAKGSFGADSFPMLAVSTDGAFSFRNLCSVLKVSMTGEESVNSIKFISHDGWMPVSGKATVRTGFTSAPELEMAEDGSLEVTLECGSVSLSPSSPTDFFIIIPSGTYHGGFTVEIKTFHGTVKRSTEADITFERSQFRSIPTFVCEGSGEIDPDNIPFNEIWYVTRLNAPISVSSEKFDRELVSNVYENGKGVLTFDGPVTALGREAFRFQDLLEVRLPDCVKTIGDYAFSNNSISFFKTPEQLVSVGSGSFEACQELRRFYGKWTSADEKAIILEGGVMAAYAMGALTPDLVIPEGVTILKDNLFSNCSILETLTLPASLEDVGEFAFAGVNGLKSIQGPCELILDEHTVVNRAGSIAILALGSVTDYVMPEGVKGYGGVFGHQEQLKSVTFANTLMRRTAPVFEGCPQLEFFYGQCASDDHHFICLSNVDGMGDALWETTSVCPEDYHPTGIEQVFYIRGAQTVRRLTFEDIVHSFRAYGAFMGMSNLRYLRLSASLKTLGQNPFAECDNLDSLFLRSYIPPSFSEEGEWAYFGHEGLRIFVPRGTEDQYKAASGWSAYAQYIEGFDYDDLEKPDYYISTDYSEDGKVTALQAATEGKGINLILMGDAFSDRQIAEGLYDNAMQRMVDAFFSEEPYSSYRELFNVYSVTVVSATEGYDHGGTALGGWFGGGTEVGGVDQTCMEYARKAIPESEMDHTVIIVAMNRDYYAGTCYMYYPSDGDYGNGLSVAYFPTSSDEVTFNGLVRHEAGGHGFAKLADEYQYDGAIPDEEKNTMEANFPYGWWKNIDFTSDPEEVKWARFLKDSRYAAEGLGVFEGACTYSYGAWRPTEESIMRHNTGGFNAPSREAIWYRMHKLAYGDDWQYNYEDFVAYDARNRKSQSTTKSTKNFVELPMEPTHPPVVIPRRWNEPTPTVDSQQYREAVMNR